MKNTPTVSNPMKKRHRVRWGDRETCSLIRVVELFNIEKTEWKTGSKGVKWEKVAERLKIDRDSCKSRWAKLKRMYKDHIQNQRRTGMDRRTVPFQTKLADVLDLDPNVKTHYLITQSHVPQSKFYKVGNSIRE